MLQEERKGKRKDGKQKRKKGKGETLENCNEKATWTSTAGNAGERIPHSKDQPFPGRSSTVFPEVSRCKELLLLECLQAGKVKVLFLCLRSPGVWLLLATGCRGTSGIMRSWSSSTKGAHSCVIPRKSKGEGSDPGQTQGCGPVVLSSIILAMGQDWQAGVPRLCPGRGHQTDAAVGCG